MCPEIEVAFYEFGDFRIDVMRRQLLKQGKLLTITNKTFLTLLILVERAEQLVTRDELISQLWNDTFVEESNLSQHIYILRKTLGRDETGKPYIETVTKQGFRLTVPVTVVLSTKNYHAARAEKELVSYDQNKEPELVPGKHLENFSFQAQANKNFDGEHAKLSGNLFQFSQSKGLLKTNWSQQQFLFLILLFITMLTGIFFYKGQYTPPEEHSRPIKLIAVLPFQSIGEDVKNEELGLRLTDAIIINLSRTKSVPVCPTSSILQFVDKPDINSLEVGHQLSADAVMEGTVQRQYDWVRISVKLINVKTGESLMTEVYDEKFSNVFTLQDTVSNKVAKSISKNIFNSDKDVVYVAYDERSSLKTFMEMNGERG